ncbi:MAG: hypothetical protein GY716_03025 [bacterium]|nr:hypothetical protein [bacterium]
MRTPNGLLPLVLLAASVAAAEGETIYTRADASAAGAGEVRLRRAYTPRLELPHEDCEEGTFSCVRDEVYGQLYRLDFFEDEISRLPEGRAVTERTDRGSLLIAVSLATREEAAFESELIAHLQSLGVPSFADATAGMAYGRIPLKQSTLVRSTLPVWVCREEGGGVRADMLFPGGAGVRSYSRTGDVARRGCGEIDSALEEVPAETFRTMPEVREQILHEVLLREISTLGAQTWSADLVRIPASVTFEKTRLEPGKKTGGSRDRADGVYRGKEGRYGDVERKVRIPAASLELTAAPMWAGRWTFRATRHATGRDSVTTELPQASIDIAVLPIADPTLAESVRVATSLSVPLRELLDETLSRFERSATLDPALVTAAFADPERWPAAGDWMVVACLDDGRAFYGIAPFAAVSPVSNPLEACSAVARELDD